MKKIYSFNNNNGTFICFNEFENEDQYPEFLNFIQKSLGSSLQITGEIESPYSIVTNGLYNDVPISIIYDDNAESCLFIEKKYRNTIDKLLSIFEK